MDFQRIKQRLQEKLSSLKQAVPEKAASISHAAKQAASDSAEHTKSRIDSMNQPLHESQTSTSLPQRIREAFGGHQQTPPERLFVDIKPSTVAKTVIIVLGLFYLAQILSQLTEILVLILLSVIIASALGPIVDKWHARGMNRIAATIILYLLILVILSVIISAFIPLVGSQIMSLASSINALAVKIAEGGAKEIPFIGPYLTAFTGNADALSSDQLIEELRTQLQNIGTGFLSVAGNIWQVLGSFFGGLFSFLTVLMLSFYMVLQKHSFEEFISTLIPSRYEAYTIDRSHLIREKMGAWLRGQLTVCSIIAVMIFVGLSIIGVPYALTIGVFGGLMTIIPYIGPAIATIVATLIALTATNPDALSPGTALLTAAYHVIAIQFIESNFVTPLVMKRAVDLNPITILIVLLVGGQLYGLMGVILAIPITTAVKIFVKDLKELERPIGSSK